MRTDVADIVRAARGVGLYVNLITAAVGLTPEKADALVAAGVEHVQISVQDATSEGCNRITNYKNAFEKKLGALRAATGRPERFISLCACALHDRPFAVVYERRVCSDASFARRRRCLHSPQRIDECANRLLMVGFCVEQGSLRTAYSRRFSSRPATVAGCGKRFRV